MAVILREAKEWILYLTGKLDSTMQSFIVPHLLINIWWHFTVATEWLMYLQRSVWKHGQTRVKGIHFSI
jgi:hypothetical protein